MTRPLGIFREERGNSAIEMALAAPLLAALLIGMVDVSRAYSSRLVLEQVAQRTIERVQQTGFDPTQEPALEAEAADAAGAGSTADVVFTLECDGVSQGWTTTCSAGQAYARYVTVTVTSSFTPMFDSGYFPGSNADGTVALRGEAGIRVQ